MSLSTELKDSQLVYHQSPFHITGENILDENSKIVLVLKVNNKDTIVSVILSLINLVIVQLLFYLFPLFEEAIVPVSLHIAFLWHMDSSQSSSTDMYWSSTHNMNIGGRDKIKVTEPPISPITSNYESQKRNSELAFLTLYFATLASNL